jgi:hypothetical protein
VGSTVLQVAVPKTQLLLSAGSHADIRNSETYSDWQRWQSHFGVLLIGSLCLLAWQRDKSADVWIIICVVVENVFMALETVFKVSCNTDDFIFTVLFFSVGHY